MSAWLSSLQAEALRISRRWDVWLLGAVALLAAVAMYLGAFQQDTAVMGIGNPGSWGPAPEGDPPDQWFLDAMLSLRAPYAFPMSLVTVLDGSWVFTILGAYVAVVTFGADFGWGTIRTILLARRSRTRYLAARLATIALALSAVFALLVAVAPVSQALLSTFAGERFPADPRLPQSLPAVLATRLLSAFSWAALAAALTLVARSIVGGLALLTTVALVDAGLRLLPSDGALGIVRDASISGSVAAVIDRLRPAPVAMTIDYTVGGLVPNAQQLPPPAHAVPAEVGAIVLVAWLALGILVAWWRVRNMDVVD